MVTTSNIASFGSDSTNTMLPSDLENFASSLNQLLATFQAQQRAQQQAQQQQLEQQQRIQDVLARLHTSPIAQTGNSNVIHPTSTYTEQLALLSQLSVLQKLQAAVATQTATNRLLRQTTQHHVSNTNTPSLAAFQQLLAASSHPTATAPPIPASPSASILHAAAAQLQQPQFQTHWSPESLAPNVCGRVAGPLVLGRSNNSNPSPPRANRPMPSSWQQQVSRAVISSDDSTSSASTPTAAGRERYDLDENCDSDGDGDGDDGHSTASSSNMSSSVLSARHQPQPRQQLKLPPIPPTIGSQQKLLPKPEAPRQQGQLSQVEALKGLDKRFGTVQTQKWQTRYKELVQFVRTNGHTLVPLEYKDNAKLAHWVKRQRNQYKSKVMGQRSTLTAERQQLLEDLGFCWNAHLASWEERINDLKRFKAQMGHCNVPCSDPATQTLGVWVKCQRRQYKLFATGKKSHLDSARVEQLNQLGIEWCRRDRC